MRATQLIMLLTAAIHDHGDFEVLKDLDSGDGVGHINKVDLITRDQLGLTEEWEEDQNTAIPEVFILI